MARARCRSFAMRSQPQSLKPRGARFFQRRLTLQFRDSQMNRTRSTRSNEERLATEENGVVLLHTAKVRPRTNQVNSQSD